MPRLTDAQLDDRARGLGATDIATAAGVNPYSTPYQLYLEKIGELDPDALIDERTRGRLDRGHWFEDVALKWDRELHGDPFIRVSRTIWHKTLPFLYCHPDAARDRALRHLVEVKTGRAWRDGVPKHVEVQVHAQMAITGAQRVTVLLQTFDGPPERFDVERDQTWIDAVEELGRAFWDRVLRRDPPPMDGSREVGRWLDGQRKLPGEPETFADEGQRALLVRLLRARERIESGVNESETLTNQLKLSMLGTRRLVAPGLAKVVWTEPTAKGVPKWKEIALTFNPDEELIAAHTGPGTGRFLVTDEREEKE